MSDSSTPRVSGWVKYYTATEGRPPRPTLLAALDRFAAEGICGIAVDLGCGDGRDAIELLRRGWRVIGDRFRAGGTRAAAHAPRSAAGGEARSARRDIRGSDVGHASSSSIRASRCLSVRRRRSPRCGARSMRRSCQAGALRRSLCGPRDSWAERGMDNRSRSPSTTKQPRARSSRITRSSFSRSRKPIQSRRAARRSTGISFTSSRRKR